MTININAFQQAPVQGDPDLQIASSFTLTGLISTNQATALTAGTPVKLDSTVTGTLPQFVAAGQGDRALGYIKRTAQATVYAAGDKAEIMSLFGPVMYLTASGTITPGSLVESDSTGAFVQTYTSHAIRGVMLDYVTTGQLGRVLIINTSSAA